MTEKLFWLRVKFLHWVAAKCGSTYEAVNIWIFCVLWPLITLALVVLVVWQHLKIAELMHR